MRFIRSLLRGLASSGFKLGLVLLALTAALAMVLGTPGAIKQALRDSKAYDQLVDGLISDGTRIGNDTENGQTTELNVNTPQVRQAAKSAFSPAMLQSSSEQIIDSVYTWLDGKSQKPDFRIDLTEPKQRFAQSMGDYAAERAATLPVCNLQQLRELAASQEIDPFNVPCLPPGYTTASARDKVVSDLINSRDFLKDPVLTADNLPKDEQGRSVFENLSEAPRIFHWLKLAPWLIGGLCLLFALLIMGLHDDKGRGFRSIGVTLLGSGLFLVLGTALYSFAFNRANQPHGQLGKAITTDLQGSLLSVLRSLNNALSTKIFFFGGAYILLGAAALLYLHFNHRLKEVAEVASNPAVPNQDFHTATLPPIESEKPREENQKP